MKIAKTILILLLIILVIPIFSTVALSLSETSGMPLKWYGQIIHDDSFLNSFFLTFYVSIITSVVSLIFSFILSLSWFDKKQRYIVLFFLLIFGLLPPDILSLAITKVAGMFGLYNANILLMICGLTLYCLPFSVLILWARYYFIDRSLLIIASDIGVEGKCIISRIILPMSFQALVSCATLNFLLAFNEFPRTYYLSGAYVFISEFFSGKLNSGTDDSVYAGASLVVISTVFLIIAFSVFQSSRLRQQKNATID
jgi:ABC-type spermidine/putrescine transport system permease subunit II